MSPFFSQLVKLRKIAHGWFANDRSALFIGFAVKRKLITLIKVGFRPFVVWVGRGGGKKTNRRRLSQKSNVDGRRRLIR